VLLLFETAQATHSRESALHQQTESLRHRATKRGKKERMYAGVLARACASLTQMLQRKLILQVNAKRQPSFSGSTNGNGTLRGKNNPNVNGLGSPKLYPKSLDYESATLKRNSHGQQHIRADLDQDKYY